MINTQIPLAEQTYDSLQAITKQTGKTSEELIIEAIDKLIAEFDKKVRLKKCGLPEACGKIVKIYLTLNKYVARGSV
jgi:hypothetical protein